MLRLSELFGVSTDYLLKDELEEAAPSVPSDDTPSWRHVSMEEANAFLSVKAQTSKTIAYAAFLCILSPIVLFLLNAISGSKAGALNEDAAVGIGMIVLILLLAAAAVYTAYWFVATAVYLGYSLWSNTWGRSWIIWVIAGVLFPAVLAITSAFEKKTK